MNDQTAFAKFKAGDDASLVAIIDSQRTILYDYVLRMTGQQALAAKSTDDFSLRLSTTSKNKFENLIQLRIDSFCEVRDQNKANWNAQTVALENDSIAEPNEKFESFMALDHSLRRQEGVNREIVILKHLCDFDFASIAKIMDFPSAQDIEAIYDQTMQQIDAEVSGVVQQPESTLSLLPRHKYPDVQTEYSTDLSMMMKGLKERPSSWGGVVGFLYALLIIIPIVLVIYYFFTTEFIEYFK